jgi:quinol-cytochrome oxidoreductase complex cytochrome b subunit
VVRGTPGAGWRQEFIAHKTVPVHSATMWYYFGGITLFLVIQVLPASCFSSTTGPRLPKHTRAQFIVTRVQFGWLVRSIHSWSANLMILAAFIHMFSVVFLRSYRRPREVTWLSGITLLGLSLAFGFSGYLLPWNTISYFATKVGTDMAASVPVIGPPLARFLRGGDDVGGATHPVRVSRRCSSRADDVGAHASPAARPEVRHQFAAEDRRGIPAPWRPDPSDAVLSKLFPA